MVGTVKEEWGGLAQYSSEGSYLGQIGKPTIHTPGAITVDSEGNIWVVDYLGGTLVRALNSKGEYLTTIFKAPLAMAAATQGSIWMGFSAVSDEVQKWSQPVPEELSGMAVSEPFDGGTTSKANYSANWSKLGWATEKGNDETTGWRPVGHTWQSTGPSSTRPSPRPDREPAWSRPWQ